MTRLMGRTREPIRRFHVAAPAVLGRLGLLLSLAVTALAVPVGARAAQLPDVVVRSAYFGGGEGTASCNAGEVATGGGVGVDIVGNTYVARSQPAPQTGAPTAWNAWLRERADGSAISSGTVYVVCARPTATGPPVTTQPPGMTAPPVTTPPVSPTPRAGVQIQRGVVYFPRDGLQVNHEWSAHQRY